MKRRWRWILLLCLILMIPVSASANSPAPGPNYDFSLELVNAPSRPYIVGILTREQGAKQIELVKHIKPDQREMLAALFSLEAEDWYPVSEVPESGLVQDGGRRTIDWLTIAQSMKEYRVILVTESGTVHVSDPIIHRDYANEATYDVKTSELTQHIDYWEYARRIIIAVVITLVVELWLLKVSEFSNPRNRRVVIVTNLFTQTLLNVVLFVTHYYEFSKADFTWLLILEVAIPIIEGFVYAKLFDQGTVRQRVQYAVIANLASFAIGLFLYGIVSFLYAIF